MVRGLALFSWRTYFIQRTHLFSCHNSLLWFIERVELLTSDPIQTQQYFLIHLERALYVPAQGLNFHLDQKYLTPIWKGKGEGKLYLYLVSSVTIDDSEWESHEGAASFQFGDETKSGGMGGACGRRKYEKTEKNRTFTWFVASTFSFSLLLCRYEYFFCFIGARRFFFLLCMNKLVCHSLCQPMSRSGIRHHTTLVNTQTLNCIWF